VVISCNNPAQNWVRVRRIKDNFTIECGSEVEYCLIEYSSIHSNKSFYLDANSTSLLSLNSMKEATYLIQVTVIVLELYSIFILHLQY